MNEKSTENKPVKITVDIRPGLASPAQKRAWDGVWRRLIVEAKQSENEK
jgi:hypothetical protein